jgi:hypothetical protein
MQYMLLIYSQPGSRGTVREGRGRPVVMREAEVSA